MKNDNDVHTVIDYNGIFSHVDDFKHSVPLLIRGNDPSLSEIAIALSMARDSNYRMPNDLRVFLSSWNSPHPPIELTRIISDHYISHLRNLFPTRHALVSALKEHAATFVRYHHSDSTPDDTHIEEYLDALWNSIPPSDTSSNLPLRLMGNGSEGDKFALAHWFSLPHVIVAIPPVPLLSSAVGDAIRNLSEDIVIEVTSGIPTFWNHIDRLIAHNQNPTCGAFRLSVDIAKQNPLNDELEQIRKDVEKIIDIQTQHENRLNEHETKIQKLEERISEHDIEIKNHENRLNGHDAEILKHGDRLNGHDTTIQTHEDRLNGQDIKIQQHENRISDHDAKISDLNADIEKLNQSTSAKVTLIEVVNNDGNTTIRIDGNEGDITFL